MNFRRSAVLLLLCVALIPQIASAASPNVVISQIYGGGGNAGATFKNDFIELFNRGTAAVNLTGWSVQYTSSAGTTWTPTALTGSIAPGQYYLVQEGPGAGGTVNLPPPDASGTIAMSATTGKVALVSSTTALTGACPGGVVDLIGYGSGANCSEGVVAATLTNTTAALRAQAGCTDTDNNSTDFSAGAPNPRNTTAPIHTCTVGANAPPVINAPLNPIATVSTGATPFTVNLSGSDDGSIFNWSATAGSGVQSVSATSGQNAANVTYTVTLTAGFSGTASFTAILSDTVNAPVSQLVNIQVNGVVVNNPPTITPPANPIRTVTENRTAFTVSLTGFDDGGIYAWSATPGPGIATATVSAGQSTPTATFTLTLQTDFTGNATFTAFVTDNVNPAVSQVVTVNVNPPPAPPNHVVISQVYGGGGNSGATFHNDYVELYNPTNTTFDLRGWSIQYGSATGSIFTGVTSLAGLINPGEYYLIALASGGSPGATLPPANATNDLVNMSATSGKVALWNTGSAISVACPLGDPHLVDLVGYGTANCGEGNVNAPAATNTTALFRINGGSTDTDINADDFVSGVPTPRRTAAFAEVGPTVASTDPAAGDSGTHGAPRDGSITVTFSEPVTVDPSWFNITCATSGTHNDATVAGGGTVWVITPNFNFTGGEQCTVTLTGNAVHDVDLDDSAPGTDTLPADFTWSFFVAPAATYPYPPEVHLTMGNPTNAIADPNTPNNYLMMKPEYALSYNRDLGRPNWVSWHLTTEWFGSLARIDTFRPDPAVLPDWYRVQATDFFTTGFDRGHMCPNADRDGQTSIVQETFVMSNMVAQAPDNNQGPWAQLEGYLRTLASAGDELYIVSGPAGIGGTGSNGGVTMTLANGHVTVPAYTWKAVIILPKQDGNDVARVTASTPTVAVIMPNVNGIFSNDWHQYLTSVDAIEQLTGYDLFSNVPAAIQNAIEAGVNGDNPPGVADELVSTPEDTAKTITLDVAAPNSNPLTYTIVTQPLHGTLTGSDVTQTYTPAPDYNGSDSFTYRVSDGTHTSNTAKVTITILEANDPPIAVDDSKSTDEDTLLNFAWSDLTGNDTAGPANESAQTLTVTAVSPAADTHGAVALNGTQITYMPEANYNGPASFSYTVCDNGITAGVTDSRCATATVHLTIVAVNDPPTAGDDSKTTDEDTPFTFAASDLMSNDSAGPANEADQVLAVTSVTPTADTHGTVTLNAGQISYAPEANYNGPASFTYRVCDNGLSRGASDPQCATATVHLTINPVNDPPTASITVASTSAEGTPITASVSVTDPDAGDTFTYAWSVTRNGAPYASATSTSFTFTPNDNGSYVVSVTMTDHAGATGSDSKTVTVTNVAPSAAINGAPASSAEGTPIALSAVVSDPGSADTFTYSWIVTRNGAPYATGNAPLLTFTPADNGSYAVALTVTDDDGGSGSASASITVNNVAPVITSVSLSSAAIDENGSVTLTGAFTDPGDDTHTVSINWGDGSAVTPVTLTHGSRTFSASHQYLDDTPSGTPSDVLSISVTLADNDGGTANSTTPITVKNVAPVITSVSGPTAPLTIGGTATINVHYTDVGSRDTHTVLLTWDDATTSIGTCAAGLCTASRTFPATGVFSVTITVTDDDGGVAAAQFAYVIVTNPNGPFVTGGGWFTSAFGKVEFSFNSKYQKNKTAPAGELELEREDIKFKSTSMDWLVVAGSKAQFAGTGSVNSFGTFRYLVTVVDGPVDKFRIRIWDKTTGTTVFDNVPGALDDIDDANPQPIGNGSIVIH